MNIQPEVQNEGEAFQAAQRAAVSSPAPAAGGPDLNALLRETMGAAKQLAAATPKRWPPESGALVLLGAAGALVAGVVPGIGEPLRLAGIGAGAFVVALIGAARHGKRD